MKVLHPKRQGQPPFSPAPRPVHAVSRLELHQDYPVEDQTPARLFHYQYRRAGHWYDLLHPYGSLYPFRIVIGTFYATQVASRIYRTSDKIASPNTAWNSLQGLLLIFPTRARQPI